MVGTEYEAGTWWARTLVALGVVATLAAAPAQAQAPERWKLTSREFPTLPSRVKHVQLRSGVVGIYLARSGKNGRQVTFTEVNQPMKVNWVSSFEWEDPAPEMVSTGQEIRIAMKARWDRRAGTGGGTPYIYSSLLKQTAEGRRSRLPGLSSAVDVRRGRAYPPSNLGPQAATDVYQVTSSRKQGNAPEIRLEVRLANGGDVDQLLARYVYTLQGGGGGSGGPPASPSPAGRLISFQASNFPGLFIRHRNFGGEISKLVSALDRRDATFREVPGLAGSGVSFESVNYPGHYLRHQGFRIVLAKRTPDALFAADASFQPRPGLAGSGTSFESVNYPGRYIRHRNFQLYLEGGNDALFRADATFVPMGGRSL